MSFNIKNPFSDIAIREKLRKEMVRSALLENRLSKKYLIMLSEQTVGSEVVGSVAGSLYRINSIDPVDIGKSLVQVVEYPPTPSVVGRVFELQRVIDEQGYEHPVVTAVVKAADNLVQADENSIEDPVAISQDTPDETARPAVAAASGIDDNFETTSDTSGSRIVYRDPAFKNLVGETVSLTADEKSSLERIADRTSRVDYIGKNTRDQVSAIDAVNFILDRISLPETGIPKPDSYESQLFGQRTHDAVEAFQEYVGFTGSDIDGIVGKNTAAALLGRPASVWLRFRGNRTEGPLWQPAVDRAESLSRTTAVPPAGIYAFEARESSHRPDAFAWNGHVFMRNLDTDEERELGTSAGFKTRGDSRYGSNAIESFRRAYEINPSAAIKGGAWGLYQVLGVTSLGQYDSPESFLDSFNRDPALHSARAFEAWTARRPDFVENIDDYIRSGTQASIAAAVRRYFGATNSEYTDEIMQNIQRYIAQKPDSETV